MSPSQPPTNEIHYFRHQRGAVDTCNLCLTRSRLTWDHVPPRGSGNFDAVEVATVMGVLTGRGADTTVRTIQNGLKYRTLCNACNNLLGTHYDRAISAFCTDITRHVQTHLVVPEKVRFRCRPAAIIRGILGHLIAAKIDIDTCVFDDAMRRCVLNPKIRIPDDIYMYYWIHPYRSTVILRDFIFIDLRLHDSMMFCQMLKSFPISYLIADSPSYPFLPKFPFNRTMMPNDEADVIVDLARVMAEDWPERPAEHTAISFGQAGAASPYARPKASRKKGRP